VTEFATQLHVAPEALRAVLKEKSPITMEMAKGVERELGVAAYIWLEMQRKHDTHPSHGGKRTGAGRKLKGLKTKQLRISAPEDKMQAILNWLSEQPNQARAVAEALYREAGKRG
jgi:plasmid maintenance system antidote protein VapI